MQSSGRFFLGHPVYTQKKQITEQTISNKCKIFTLDSLLR